MAKGFQIGNKLRLGKKQSWEWKKKMNKINRGNKYTLGKHWTHSEKIKENYPLRNKGKHHSEETKKKMSLIKLGKYTKEQLEEFLCQK